MPLHRSPFCLDIAVLDACSEVVGYASADLSNLFVEGPSTKVSIANISCEFCYGLMLRADRRSPHCERKFRFIFAPLYGPTTWGQVHLMPLDRPVIDLCWCDSHGVCTRLSALSFFGYDIEQNLFCGLPLESLYHLFFFVLSPRVASRGPLAPTLGAPYPVWFF